jgi:hypothetical protein
VAAAPAPPAQTSLLPTVTPRPTTRPILQGGPISFTSPKYGYTVALPCCWVGMPAPAVVVEAALAGLAPAPEPEQSSGELAPAQLAEALELVAILPDDQAIGTPKAQLTVSVLPSAGLTLDQYLEATADELGRMNHIEVHASRLDSTLHPNNLPAAAIEYRNGADHSIAGLQIAYYLAEPEHLLVLTFTTAEQLYPELAPTFAAIARQVALATPA